MHENTTCAWREAACCCDVVSKCCSSSHAAAAAAAFWSNKFLNISSCITAYHSLQMSIYVLIDQIRMYVHTPGCMSARFWLCLWNSLTFSPPIVKGVYAYTRTHIHTCMNTPIHTYICMYEFIHTCIYTHMLIYNHTYKMRMVWWMAAVILLCSLYYVLSLSLSFFFSLALSLSHINAQTHSLSPDGLYQLPFSPPPAPLSSSAALPCSSWRSAETRRFPLAIPSSLLAGLESVPAAALSRHLYFQPGVPSVLQGDAVCYMLLQCLHRCSGCSVSSRRLVDETDIDGSSAFLCALHASSHLIIYTYIYIYTCIYIYIYRLDYIYKTRANSLLWIFKCV